MIVFKDPAVAAKYTTDQTADKIHHLPGRKTKKGWKGLLSNIPLEQADRWINQPKQNLLKIKVPVQATDQEEE
jgi:hypothetical protein